MLRQLEQRVARLEAMPVSPQDYPVWDARAFARMQAALRALPPRPAEHHEPRTVEQVRQALDVARASPKSFLTATDYRQLRIDLLENELQELEAVHAQAN